MTKTEVIIGGIAIATVACILAFMAGIASVPQAQQTSTGNVITQSIIPSVNSSQTVAVGPQAVITLATAVSNCTSRIIGTASSSLMLSFSSSIAPTSTIGYWQSSSSTVSYDNAVYGCGAITAYSPASSTITVTQLTQ